MVAAGDAVDGLAQWVFCCQRSLQCFGKVFAFIDHIRQHYDGNPQRHLGPDNEVNHFINTLGFLGSEFGLKRDLDTIQIVKLDGIKRSF